MTEQIHLVVATPCFGGQLSRRDESWADLESRLDHVGPPVFVGAVSSQFATAANTPARAANAT